MIQGVGIDIVDMERFTRAVNRWGERFINRILTPAEISYCRRKAFANQSMAARFAAKEAAFKCLSVEQQSGFRWHEIEVVGGDAGRPYLRFSGRLKTLLKNINSHVSLSHMGNTAAAMVVIEQIKEG